MRALTTFILLVALTLGCGASQRESTLRTSFVSVNAVRDGFAAWDQAHQAGIVQSATSLADGQAKLAAYRAARERVDAAFQVAYRAVAFAAVTEDAPLSQVLTALAELQAAVVALREHQPAPSAAAPAPAAPTTAPPAP
jgi:hypothetical protein